MKQKIRLVFFRDHLKEFKSVTREPHEETIKRIVAVLVVLHPEIEWSAIYLDKDPVNVVEYGEYITYGLDKYYKDEHGNFSAKNWLEYCNVRSCVDEAHNVVLEKLVCESL